MGKWEDSGVAVLLTAEYERLDDEQALPVAECAVLRRFSLVNGGEFPVIGRSIHLDLSRRLFALVESWSRIPAGSRRTDPINVDVLTRSFNVASTSPYSAFLEMIVAIARLALASISILMTERSVIRITLMVILAPQIVRQSDLRRDRSWSVADADVPPVTDKADR